MAEVDKGNRGDETTKQVKRIPNPTGRGGFGDNPQNRHNGAWKKENTPRGKLEKLLSETTLGEFLEQIQENTDTNLNANLGDVLISGRLHNVIKQDPDNNSGKVSIDSNEMDKLLYFVYGSKSENDMKLSDGDGKPLIKGFVIPTLPKDFIKDDGSSSNDSGEQHA